MAFLPGLVASLIFKYATTEAEPRQAIATLANCSSVCKQWQQLIARDETEDERLWGDIAMRLSPAFPDSLADLLFWEGERSFWRSACKLHLGWVKAFIAPLPQSKLNPSIFDALCDLDLPPVPRSCYRIFPLAASALTSRSPFLINPRRSADLPQLEDALITFDYHCHHFTVLTADRPSLRAECGTIFPGMEGRCHVSGHCRKAMHLRKVDSSKLPMIFAESKNGLMYYREDEAEEEEDNDDDDEVNVVEEVNTDRDQINGERGENAVCKAAHDEAANDEATHGEHAFVVHNVLSDLTCDLWVVSDEPFLYAYWKELLVYCPWSSPGFCSNIVKCVKSGITGVQCWCIDVDVAPTCMEVNSKYVAVIGNVLSVDNFRKRLILMSIETGQVLRFFDMKMSVNDDMLLTDTFLVLSIDRTPPTVYGLPDLEALYALPLPNCNNAPVSFITLSPCSTYLGLSTFYGDFVIYDMSKGSIEYCGSNGLGPPKNYYRKVGDGVWLWYKDIQAGSCEVVAEKVLYWQLRQPDLEHYRFLSSIG